MMPVVLASFIPEGLGYGGGTGWFPWSLVGLSSLFNLLAGGLVAGAVSWFAERNKQ